MSDYLMVPVKYSVLSVVNKNERLIYVPVATTETPGIVTIGDGLNVDYYGLLKVNDDIVKAANTVNNNDIFSRGVVGYIPGYKYPKDVYVMTEGDIYLSLVDDNDSELTDEVKWKKTKYGTSKVNITEGKYQILNSDSGINIKYNPYIGLLPGYHPSGSPGLSELKINLNNAELYHSVSSTSTKKYARTKIDDDGYIIESVGLGRPKLRYAANELEMGATGEILIDADIAELKSDVLLKQNSVDNSLLTTNKTVTGAINEINKELTYVKNMAEGVTVSFTVENLDELASLFGITITSVEDFYDVPVSNITYRDKEYSLKNGYLFFVIQSDVPDYWFSLDDLKLYKTETEKVDFTDYYNKSEVDVLILNTEDFVVRYVDGLNATEVSY